MIALTVEPEPLPPDTESPQPPRKRGEADLSLLEDRFPQWGRISRGTAAFGAGLALLFAFASFMPLWHTDVWGHLTYGRWIVEHRTVPETEPLLPLCEGVRFVDTAWLSQVLGYLAEKALGVTVLQFLFAAGVTLSLGIMGVLVARRTQSLAAASIAVLTFLIVDYQQLIIARPQLSGLVCFVTLFGILTSPVWRGVYWLAVPAMFTLWANLHGSFPMGLVLMACFVAGRAFDVYRRTGVRKALWQDGQLRRHFLLLQLSAAAVLINPYGLQIYFETVRVAMNRNLLDLVDWDPLTLRMSQGKAAAFALIGLVIALRVSPKRVTVSEALALIVFGLGACWSSRIIVWWAPVCAYCIAIHTAAALRRWQQWDLAEEPKRSGLSTVALLGILWIAFAYSPFGMRVLHGAPKSPEDAAARLQRSVSLQTPSPPRVTSGASSRRAVLQYLRDRRLPPLGRPAGHEMVRQFPCPPHPPRSLGRLPANHRRRDRL